MIGWRNQRGWWSTELDEAKVMEASVGVEKEKVLDILVELESKRGTVQEPTGWVLAYLGSVATKKQEADGSSTWKGMLAWLNRARFGCKLDEEEIKKAAGGMKERVMTALLAEMETKVALIQDPTGWLISYVAAKRAEAQESDVEEECMKKEAEIDDVWKRMEAQMREAFEKNLKEAKEEVMRIVKR